MIIALGESIVAIGVGAAGALDFGIGAVAVLGVALAAAMWWIYFDVVALISARRLGEAEVGREQNELARDSYSYIHLAAGRRDRPRRLRPEDDDRPHRRPPRTRSPPSPCSAASPVYLLGLVAFRYRHVQTINRQRLGLAIVLLILVPVATAMPAVISLAIVDVLIWTMIAYEHRGYGERRDQLRHEAAVSHS